MLQKIVSYILLFCLPGLVTGQVLAEQGVAKSSYGDCGPSLVVDFEVNPVGGLQQQFVPVIDSGDFQIMERIWTYYDYDVQQVYGSTIYVTYGSAGTRPVCLSVVALDPGQGMQNCQTTTCKLVAIHPDSSCLGFLPDFTIASVNGNTVTFQELSSLSSIGTQWSFSGGELVSFGTEPTHTFIGPGPHEVCLYIQGPSPANCSASICKWLYLGPGDVPCEQVLEPGFVHYQHQNVVLVVDTSKLSGQNSSLLWDFGDGSTASGMIAVHAYDAMYPEYQICAEMELWGPLVNDTCHATLCRNVQFAATSIADAAVAPSPVLFPNPAMDRIRIDGLDNGPVDLIISDALGRTVDQRIADNGVLLEIGISHLAPGTYSLKAEQRGTPFTFRFIKVMDR